MSKNKTKIIILSLLTYLLFFFAQNNAHAQYGIYGDSRDFPAAGLEVGPNQAVPTTNTTGTYQNQEKIPGSAPTSDFPAYMKQIIGFGYAVIGILAMFMLCVGAYQYLMAAGNLATTESAKGTISSALLGLVLGISSFVILRTINPDLVSLRGPNLGSLSGGGAGTSAGGGTTPVPGSYTSNAPAEIQQKAKEYAAKHGVPESVAMGMLSKESGGVNGLTSSKGAAGLLQLMPGTAGGLGVTDVMDIDQNLNAGYLYANQMYNKYGDWGLAMAAYNWGPGNMDSYLKNGVGLKGPMPRETINYVNGVMGGCSFCPS